MIEKLIKNPIITGFFPDPSICRVEEDYYLVCSSFELYPGIPIFHSKDLVNWEMICNAMTKENGFHVEYNAMTGGLMAPTIRYFNGIYYIICANFCDKGNYIVTAENPAGPWSNPIWLLDVPGIDASLFIDDDGSAYILGTGEVWEDGSGKKDRGIWIAPFDLKKFKLLGKPVTIFNSGMRIGVTPESPHIYHVGDYYYLLIAEGGTEHYHSIMVARSKDVMGWYESCPANPVMTHRHMGYGCRITNIGHGDLVELPDGSWYSVMLGSRPISGGYKILGRESFICPVIWEREWPLFSPETGKVELEYPFPESLTWSPFENKPNKSDFTKMKKIPMEYIFLGTPYENFYYLDDKGLHIKCLKRQMAPTIQQVSYEVNINKELSIAFIGKRQQFINTVVESCLHFVPKAQESAGIVIAQVMNHQIRIEIIGDGDSSFLRVVVVTTDYKTPPYILGFSYDQNEKELIRIPYEKQKIFFRLNLSQNCEIYYGDEIDNLIYLTDVDLAIINPEKIGNMAGTVIGMFASGNNQESDEEAIFQWFSMKENN